MVKNGNADFDLLIAGSKGWQKTKLVSNDSSDRRIKIIGYVEEKDLAALYSAADLFVYPSIYEGFGMPVLEAMACGCPVIVSNMSSLPEIVHYAGVIVDALDATKLARKISELMNDSYSREIYSKKGLERVKEFSWNQSARIVLESLTGEK